MNASTIRLTELALSTARSALAAAEQTCRYHGTDFESAGTWMGLPRCESCKQPYRVRLALSAVERARDAIEAQP